MKRCEELECGDIGIFVYDDCGYLKKYDEHTPDKSQAEFLTDSYGVVNGFNTASIYPLANIGVQGVQTR